MPYLHISSIMRLDKNMDNTANINKKQGCDFMRKQYQRASLTVEAEKYEIGKSMEDGFQPWAEIITNGWISSEGLLQVTRKDGIIVCPFIQNRRGLIFIHEGDYIIYEEDGERHCCGGDKFANRFREIPQE